ncbi:MAG: copper homeostasis protein CutC, partial [Bacteroidales bacterium]
ASPMEVTFHRAFDMVADPSKALEDLIEAGCKRVLTSGGRNSAPEGIEWLTQLSTQANGRIKIMAGSGVNASNARSLMDAGVHALHLSGSSVYEGGMTYRNPNVSMSTASHLSEYQFVETDPAKVKAMRDVMNERK